LSENGEANRRAWYGRIYYLEENIDLSKWYLDDVQKIAVQLETRYQEKLMMLHRKEREDKLKQERSENKHKICEEEDKFGKMELGESQGGGGEPLVSVNTCGKMIVVIRKMRSVKL